MIVNTDELREAIVTATLKAKVGLDAQENDHLRWIRRLDLMEDAAETYGAAIDRVESLYRRFIAACPKGE